VVDLYRLGYHDEPIQLHDTAIVEIEETGEQFNKQIICCDIDLIDPTGSRVEIGDYIPNIIYINRDTANKASGGGGGGGGRGQTNLEDEDSKYATWFEKTDRLIGMVAGIKNGDEYIKVGEICLAINDADESLANIHADHINISATSTAHMLAGSIVYDAQGRLVLKETSGGGVYVERDNQGTTVYSGIWDAGNFYGTKIIQTINGTTQMTLKADYIDIDGVINALRAKAISCGNLDVQGTINATGTIYSEVNLYAEGDLICNGKIVADSFKANGTEHSIEWKSQTVVTSVGQTKFTKKFELSDGTEWEHAVVTDVSYNNTTVYYLGYTL
jgi:hypothetical protein